MKIAITGKGGVGKSSLAALAARVIREAGDPVVVIDADPDMNMATLLGVPAEQAVTPIIALKELIAERTGTKVGEPAPFFTMNPKVDDIPEKYWIDRQGIKLLAMGTIQRGGGGCACPENAFLKSLLGHLMIARREWVILDMEAGIEHLGRGTALGVDSMVVVVEPNRTSLETAYRIRKLAEDLPYPPGAGGGQQGARPRRGALHPRQRGGAAGAGHDRGFGGCPAYQHGGALGVRAGRKTPGAGCADRETTGRMNEKREVGSRP